MVGRRIGKDHRTLDVQRKTFQVSQETIQRHLPGQMKGNHSGGLAEGTEKLSLMLKKNENGLPNQILTFQHSDAEISTFDRAHPKISRLLSNQRSCAETTNCRSETKQNLNILVNNAWIAISPLIRASLAVGVQECFRTCL